jgi:hypothetical protein
MHAFKDLQSCKIFENLNRAKALPLRMTRGFSTLKSVSAQLSPCSFELFSGISSHPAVFFSHNEPANNTFSHSTPAKPNRLCICTPPWTARPTEAVRVWRVQHCSSSQRSVADAPGWFD